MASVCDLSAAGIIEKDQSGDVLWTWSYPSFREDQRRLLMSKSGLTGEQQPPVQFLYSQWQQLWYYIHTCQLGEEDSALPKVTAVSLVLLAKDFNPEKYEALCGIFSHQYRRSGNPATMLSSYLSVLTKGCCSSDENGKFSLTDFSSRQAFAKCSIKGLIQAFGVETILIYTGLMLKKRIVVYCPPHSLQELFSLTRTFPALVWHRQNWNILFPYVDLSGEEGAELKSTSHYVAGTTDASIEGRSELYDLFVNGQGNQITVAPHAKEAFAMGKLHKDIAMHMVQCAENDLSDQEIVKEVAGKTKELLNNLRSLASEEKGRAILTLEALKARKMPPATENFLFSLAACEGLVKV